ncbi:MAG: T9SS type A sorting domain-containing protein, partial [Sphingobacteriales bacterium]
NNAYTNLQDALLESNVIQNPATYRNETAYDQIVYARIENTNSCTGISELATNADFSVLPNPSHGEATVAYHLQTGGTTTITLLNSLGQEVGRTERDEYAGQKQHLLPATVSKLADGVYYVRLVTPSQTLVKKIIIH